MSTSGEEEEVSGVEWPGFSPVQWAEAVAICRDLLNDRPDFDKEERNYKLKVIERTEALYAAVESGAALADRWRAFLANPPNNLIQWQLADDLKKWGVGNEVDLRAALKAVAHEGTAQERVDAFVDAVPVDVLDTPGSRINVPSTLLMGRDHKTYPAFRPSPFERTQKALAWPAGLKADSPGAAYEEHLRFARLFHDGMANALDEKIDMLDAQSLLWILAKRGDPRIKAWRKEAGEMTEDDALAASVAAFRQQHPYTEDKKTEKDQEALALREEWREGLGEEKLAGGNLDAVEQILASVRYGNLGRAKSKPLKFIESAPAEDRQALAQAIRSLLHGQGDLTARLAGFLEADFPNYKETVAVKLLSIWDHQRILPVFKVHGGNAKAGLMKLDPVGLEVPEAESAAELAVKTNDLIHERLLPYFGDDAYGMSRYLYWLAAADEVVLDEDETESLDELANELYLDTSDWLTDARDLLKRKQQLIFYGPPGTGKTYIARELMKHLAPLGEQREIVQFHPSYSYEDFVRGYRPVTSEDGGLSYAVVDGPLMRLAAAARSSWEAGDKKPYILLIDEINRGNLPRIFGELLYLLEYRGETEEGEDGLRLMYSSEQEERFTLPQNLWIIGTMNTADRSIGLIDAALRRRFHFMALFPGEEPIKGTLARWLKAKEIGDFADEVAALVDQLNAHLMEQQGSYGENLKVGHSYFMEPDIDSDLLDLIWKSDVLPYLEEQLFGRDIDVASTFSRKALEPAGMDQAGGGQGKDDLLSETDKDESLDDPEPD